MPWMFPLSLVSGVLMSACASTQITAISRPSLSRIAFAVPEIVPMAMGVVASEREHAAALLGVRVDLLGQLLRNGGHGEGVLHAADVGIGRGHEVFVRVHRVVVL